MANKARQAVLVQRRTQAIALRLAGTEWQAIAEQLGYADRGAACKDVTRALEAYRRDEAEQIEQLRFTESQRLDRLQASVWHMAVEGDTKAVDSVLRIMERRAKLLGLDASKQLDIAFKQRIDLESAAVADAVAAALDALELTEEQRVSALGAAQERLLALEPGTADGP